MSLGDLGQSGASNVKNFFEQPEDKYGNDPGLELQWAMKAFHHAEVYFSLIKTVDPKALKLTPIDDEIYEDFRQRFKDMSVERVDVDEMKSTKGKVVWREFCDSYKERVEDFNMGTLLRVDAREETSEQNTVLVPRIQFLAVEIARNREGYNSGLREKFGVASKKNSDSHQKEAEVASS